MKWQEILKNIQISSQRTSSKDYVKPDEKEDCFQYFYDLVKILDKKFELKRTIFPEDYWCELFKQEWVIDTRADDTWAYLGDNPESRTELEYDIVIIMSKDKFRLGDAYVDIIFGDVGEGREFVVKTPTEDSGFWLRNYHPEMPNLKYETSDRIGSIIDEVNRHVRGK